MPKHNPYVYQGVNVYKYNLLKKNELRLINNFFILTVRHIPLSQNASYLPKPWEIRRTPYLLFKMAEIARDCVNTRLAQYTSQLRTSTYFEFHKSGYNAI